MDYQQRFKISEPKACQLMLISRSCYQYQPKRPTGEVIRRRMRELALAHVDR